MAHRLTRLTLLLSLLVLVEPESAFAQKRRSPVSRPIPRAPLPIPTVAPAPSAKDNSLKARSGFAVAVRLLRSEHEELRLQGLERLGRVGTPQALELLGKALEPAGAAQSSRERLSAVRALAPHTKTPTVRAILSRVAAGVGSSGERSDELEPMVRDTATLALARSGQPEDLELLGKALRQPGRLAESAGAALLAYPPRDLLPLLKGRFAPTRELLRVLGDLGDQRASQALRDFVKRGSPEIRAEAAVSLTRLGNFETVELARHWLRSERQPVLLEAAARILALTGAPEQTSAIATLFASKETRAAGLALAFETGLPDLVPVLAEQLRHAEAEEVQRILATLGRTPGAAATLELERALKSPERATLAMHALALQVDDAASAALSRALRVSTTRRDALRAAVVRKLSLRVSVDGLAETLSALRSSGDAADRAVASWASAVLEPQRMKQLMADKDPVVVRAAARALLVGGDPKLVAERLLTDTEPLTRTQLALALAFDAGSNRVPTSTLVQLLDEGSAAAPLAARALAERDTPAVRPRIEALLSSGDALLRSHAALGLGSSESPSAIGLLSRALRFEPDRAVRRAIVVALSRRPEPARERPLELAATLDPDATVREAARRARAGQRLDPLPLGVTSSWLGFSVTSTEQGGLTPIAVIGHAGGLMLPAVADPDGIIVLSGLGSGPLSLRLASAGANDNPKSSDKR